MLDDETPSQVSTVVKEESVTLVDVIENIEADFTNEVLPENSIIEKPKKKPTSKK